ncbi:hypothetical protein COO00_18800 [Bacillus toyonensis]|nr:hypothetical protein CON93_07175 [Bacillus toyonensis]PEA71042.1 hypothetical protein COO00_18800 [Bacillus toyonensis]
MGLAKEVVKKISGEVIQAINKVVVGRLVKKIEKKIINLGKSVLLIGKMFYEIRFRTYRRGS